MIGFLRRLRARVRYRNFDADLRRELDVHRAMVEDRLRAGGVERDDVQRLAARQVGNAVAARETARGVWIAPSLESVWQDVRYGARSLWHSRGFTITALLTLMLGVGVNTTLFSLVNAFLLQPWRVPDAHQLVLAYHRAPRSSGEGLVGVSAPELKFLQERAASVDVAGTRPVGGTLASGPSIRPARGRLVSGNYFDVLRVPIAIGRGLQREDDAPGRTSVVVLGHDLWAGFFSSDPGVVGRTIRFLDSPVTVVGVAAPSMQGSAFAGVPELWMPISSMPVLFPDDPFAREFTSNPAHCCVDLVGRLRSGHGRASAEAELSTLDREFRRDAERGAIGMRVTSTQTIHDPRAAKALPVAGLLFAAVGLVLLLTCANVGNLQLARAAARRREVTIRLALGAGRRRVIRQLLTEGLVLSVAATSLCVIVSSMLARAVTAGLDASLARLLDFSIDIRVLLFGALLTVLTCLLTSLAPAIRGTRQLVAGNALDRHSIRLRSFFLAAQIAISVVLLSAAVLFGRGLAQAASREVGFDLDTLMAVKVERRSQNRDAERVFLRDVMGGIGKRRVAASAMVPFGDASMYTVARRAEEASEADRQVRFHAVSSTYFDVLGIPLRAGRAFRDTAGDEVVINETLARMLWPDGGAIGNHLAGSEGTVGRQVVGVVADAYIDRLDTVGPTLFQPVEQPGYLLFKKGEIAPDELRAIVTGADRSASTTVLAVGDNVGASLEAASHGARIAGALGLLALPIVAVGIAGVFSFAVAERTREIGIRLALGASRRRVRTLLLRRASHPIAIGVLIGVMLALLAGQALRGYLYGLSPSDPVAYVAGLVLVILTAWTATIVPMHRAVRVDPAVTLRHE